MYLTKMITKKIFKGVISIMVAFMITGCIDGSIFDLVGEESTKLILDKLIIEEVQPNSITLKKPTLISGEDTDHVITAYIGICIFIGGVG